MKLALTLIREDGGTQSRPQLDQETIGAYADVFRSGKAMAPVVVYYDGTDYWLADGFHRVAAAVDAQLDEIDSDVRQGTQRDAILFSFGANATHGLPRTNAVKRGVVERMLRDSEWSAWSDVKIADVCRVGRHLVAKVRTELNPHLVAEPGESHMDARPGEKQRRYTTKHGTDAVMNIGRRRPLDTLPPPSSSSPVADPEVTLASQLERRLQSLTHDICSAPTRVRRLLGPELDNALPRLARAKAESAA